MTKRFATLVVTILALCLALVGCGKSDEELRKDFTGVWELESMLSDGEETTAEDFEIAKSYGMNVFLVLDEDGTCTLDLFMEEVDEGTWEASSTTSASLSVINMGGEELAGDLELSDGKLIMSSDDDKLTFARTTREDMMEYLASAEELSAALAENEPSTNDFLIESMGKAQSEVRMLDVTAIDNEYATLTLTGMYVDEEGDLMVVYRLVNKTDQALILNHASDDFTVNGAYADVTCVTEIGAGETIDPDFLYLSGVSVDDIDSVTVSGTLTITDEDGNDLSSDFVEF